MCLSALGTNTHTRSETVPHSLTSKNSLNSLSIACQLVLKTTRINSGKVEDSSARRSRGCRGYRQLHITTVETLFHGTTTTTPTITTSTHQTVMNMTTLHTKDRVLIHNSLKQMSLSHQQAQYGLRIKIAPLHHPSPPKNEDN